MAGRGLDDLSRAANRARESSSISSSSVAFHPANKKEQERDACEEVCIAENPSSDRTIGSINLASDGQLNWSLWQLLDSILPTGGFAHSLGLEAAVQVGSVFDSLTLEDFAISSIECAGALLLPFVFAASKCSTIERWKRLDCILHATLTNQVARRASITQGEALLRVATSVFVDIAQLKEMRAYARRQDDVHVHHAPVFGFLCGLLGVDSMTVQRAFLFLTSRDLFSAATRLNVVGPLEAASMQYRVTTKGEAILSKYANRSIQDAHQTAPVIDVIQGFQDHLFSRLFRS